MENTRSVLYSTPMVMASFAYCGINFGMFPEPVKELASFAPVFALVITALWVQWSWKDNPIGMVLRAGLVAMAVNFAVGSVLWFVFADPPRYGPVPSGTYGEIGNAFMGSSIIGAVSLVVFGVLVSCANAVVGEAKKD